MSCELLPLLPPWSIIVTAAVLIALLTHGSRTLAQRNVSRGWISLLFLLRLTIIAVFVVCLLRPTLSRTTEVQVRPSLLILADVSSSMARPAAEGNRTRYEETVGQLLAGSALTRLRQHYDLHWYAMAERAEAVSEAELSTIRPDRDATHIVDSIIAARQHWQALQTAANSRAACRMLVISDGGDPRLSAALTMMQGVGIPVDVLAPAAVPQPPEPLHIADVQCSPRVLIDSETRFRVTIDGKAQAANLVVSENGRQIHDQALGPIAGETQVMVAHRPERAGLTRYTFALSSEASPPVTVDLQVVDDKREVLLLEDTWRWEFKYLRRVLEDDPSFNLTAFLARGKIAYVQFGEAERRVSLAGFPDGPAELEWFDIIILGNVNPRRWPAGLARGIADGVIERGRTLIVLAGPDVDRLAQSPELGPLLPVELTIDSGHPIDGPIAVHLTRDGLTSAFFSRQPEAPSAGAPELPALDRIYAPVRKRPAATVLLEATGHANAYGKLIVMAEHQVGRGRVLYIGTDTLWKWQLFGPTDEAQRTGHRQFWQQALRAMAPPLPAAAPVDLWLETDRTTYTEGDRVSITALLQPEAEAAAIELEVTAVMPDGSRLQLPVGLDPSAAARRSTTVRAAPPGSCRITAVARRGGAGVATSQTHFRVMAAAAEQDLTAVDTNALMALAAATGGRFLSDADAAVVPAVDSPGVQTVQRRESVDLWQNFSLVLLLCCLLGADWFLRLIRGYV